MRILIDCGASNGQALDSLIKKFGPFDKVVAIEPNVELLSELSAKSVDNIVILNKLVCSDEGVKKLFLGDHFTESSMCLEKATGNLKESRYIEVECIRLSKFLVENFSLEDEIIIKMDIEGAEFDVLEDVISAGAVNLIKHLLVEWHVGRLPNRWNLRFRRAKILLWLLIRGVNYTKWH